ncbi:hypothetical protein [Paraburkholderia caffeinilytica]|uniref:hypothetical protein n=1 Tax=Paraburkholderia caffeinilytica TaxID=1761016 RepID=UPI003DA1AC70
MKKIRKAFALILLIGVCGGATSAYADTFDGLDSLAGAAVDSILGTVFAGMENIFG